MDVDADEMIREATEEGDWMGLPEDEIPRIVSKKAIEIKNKKEKHEMTMDVMKKNMEKMGMGGMMKQKNPEEMRMPPPAPERQISKEGKEEKEEEVEDYDENDGYYDTNSGNNKLPRKDFSSMQKKFNMEAIDKVNIGRNNLPKYNPLNEQGEIIIPKSKQRANYARPKPDPKMKLADIPGKINLNPITYHQDFHLKHNNFHFHFGHAGIEIEDGNCIGTATHAYDANSMVLYCKIRMASTHPAAKDLKVESDMLDTHVIEAPDALMGRTWVDQTNPITIADTIMRTQLFPIQYLLNTTPCQIIILSSNCCSTRDFLHYGSMLWKGNGWLYLTDRISTTIFLLEEFIGAGASVSWWAYSYWVRSALNFAYLLSWRIHIFMFINIEDGTFYDQDCDKVEFRWAAAQRTKSRWYFVEILESPNSDKNLINCLAGRMQTIDVRIYFRTPATVDIPEDMWKLRTTEIKYTQLGCILRPNGKAPVIPYTLSEEGTRKLIHFLIFEDTGKTVWGEERYIEKGIRHYKGDFDTDRFMDPSQGTIKGLEKLTVEQRNQWVSAYSNARAMIANKVVLSWVSLAIDHFDCENKRAHAVAREALLIAIIIGLSHGYVMASILGHGIYWIPLTEIVNYKRAMAHRFIIFKTRVTKNLEVGGCQATIWNNSSHISDYANKEAIIKYIIGEHKKVLKQNKEGGKRDPTLPTRLANLTLPPNGSMENFIKECNNNITKTQKSNKMEQASRKTSDDKKNTTKESNEKKIPDDRKEITNLPVTDTLESPPEDLESVEASQNESVQEQVQQGKQESPSNKTNKDPEKDRTEKLCKTSSAKKDTSTQTETGWDSDRVENLEKNILLVQKAVGININDVNDNEEIPRVITNSEEDLMLLDEHLCNILTYGEEYQIQDKNMERFQGFLNTAYTAMNKGYKNELVTFKKTRDEEIETMQNEHKKEIRAIKNKQDEEFKSMQENFNSHVEHSKIAFEEVHRKYEYFRERIIEQEISRNNRDIANLKAEVDSLWENKAYNDAKISNWKDKVVTLQGTVEAQNVKMQSQEDQYDNTQEVYSKIMKVTKQLVDDQEAATEIMIKCRDEWKQLKQGEKPHTDDQSGQEVNSMQEIQEEIKDITKNLKSLTIQQKEIKKGFVDTVTEHKESYNKFVNLNNTFMKNVIETEKRFQSVMENTSQRSKTMEHEVKKVCDSQRKITGHIEDMRSREINICVEINNQKEERKSIMKTLAYSANFITMRNMEQIKELADKGRSITLTHGCEHCAEHEEEHLFPREQGEEHDLGSVVNEMFRRLCKVEKNMNPKFIETEKDNIYTQMRSKFQNMRLDLSLLVAQNIGEINNMKMYTDRDLVKAIDNVNGIKTQFKAYEDVIEKHEELKNRCTQAEHTLQYALDITAEKLADAATINAHEQWALMQTTVSKPANIHTTTSETDNQNLMKIFNQLGQLQEGLNTVNTKLNLPPMESSFKDLKTIIPEGMKEGSSRKRKAEDSPKEKNILKIGKTSGNTAKAKVTVPKFAEPPGMRKALNADPKQSIFAKLLTQKTPTPKAPTPAFKNKTFPVTPSPSPPSVTPISKVQDKDKNPLKQDHISGTKYKLCPQGFLDVSQVPREMTKYRVAFAGWKTKKDQALSKEAKFEDPRPQPPKGWCSFCYAKDIIQTSKHSAACPRSTLQNQSKAAATPSTTKSSLSASPGSKSGSSKNTDITNTQ